MGTCEEMDAEAVVIPVGDAGAFEGPVGGVQGSLAEALFPRDFEQFEESDAAQGVVELQATVVEVVDDPALPGDLFESTRLAGALEEAGSSLEGGTLAALEGGERKDSGARLALGPEKVVTGLDGFGEQLRAVGGVGPTARDTPLDKRGNFAGKVFGATRVQSGPPPLLLAQGAEDPMETGLDLGVDKRSGIAGGGGARLVGDFRNAGPLTEGIPGAGHDGADGGFVPGCHRGTKLRGVGPSGRLAGQQGSVCEEPKECDQHGELAPAMSGFRER